MTFNSFNSTMSINTQIGMEDAMYISTADVSILSWDTGSNNIWYGSSGDDIIELSVWDLAGEQLGWGTLTGSFNMNDISASLLYLNELNVPLPAYVNNINNGFVIYNNQNILVNPIENLQSIGQTGSFTLVYNMVRNMAGNEFNPLIVSDISPSRTEIKLSSPKLNDSFYKFTYKQTSISEIYQQYLTSLSYFPVDNIYNTIKNQYSDSIEIIKNLTSLKILVIYL